MKKINFKQLIKNNFQTIMVVLIFITTLVYYIKLGSLVNFMQNDDWHYYAQVEKFMSGDFSLNAKIAPTFYLQGVLGALVASIFGISKIPFLTMFISLCNLVLLFLTFNNIFQNKIKAVVLAYLVFLFPLNQVALIGFMTESYFVFFALLTLYFISVFEKTKKTKFELLAILSYVLSFFVRQIGMIFPIVFFVFNFLKKNYKKAFIHLFIFILIYGFYSFIFPKTPEMTKKGLVLISGEGGIYFYYSVLVGIFSYLTAFSFPLIFLILFSNLKSLGKKRILILISITVLLYILNSNMFNGDTLSWGEFPYFENTYERTGFFPREFHGTKYHFKGIFDLYYYFEIISKFTLFIFVSFLIVSKRKFEFIFNKHMLMFFVYLSVIFLSYIMYDRYLVPLYGLFIFGLCLYLKDIKTKYFISILPFIFFLFVYAHLFLQDFVLIRNYSWNKSSELINQGVNAFNIRGNSAWNNRVGFVGKPYYIFSFDSPEVAELLLKVEYELVDTFTPNYVFNIYVNPKIYLYKLKDEFKQ